MHESFNVQSASGNYTVTIGENLFARLNSQANSILLIDAHLASFIELPPIPKITVPALESSKDLDAIATVVEQMRKAGVGRDTHVYAVGGGVIQDVATFVTSIYMRGLSWTYLPSTLLSMADSCIGGKSSINVRGYKNLVGNIYPPQSVLVDLNFCQTLGAPEIIGGLAEAVKICFARSPDSFLQFLQLDPYFPFSKSTGFEVITLALLTKKWFVEIDEFDQQERLLLNYGHTFGHALEATSNFQIAHGVAVALGMLVANQYALLLGNMEKNGHQNCQRLNDYLIRLLESLQSHIQSVLRPIPLTQVLTKFMADKKHRQLEYRMVLPNPNGLLYLHACPKDDLSNQRILLAFEKTFQIYGYC